MDATLMCLLPRPQAFTAYDPIFSFRTYFSSPLTS